MEKSIYAQRLDLIQSEIWARLLKPSGFKKRGRHFNRESSGGLIQVITFQMGQTYREENDRFSVHIGVRVPESYERTFSTPERRSFYPYYYCNITSALNEGVLGHAAYEDEYGDAYNAKVFTLRKDDLQPIIAEIHGLIVEHVLPFFTAMESRDKVLQNRRSFHERYVEFELTNESVLDIEEAMIYGHTGDIARATQIIQQRFDRDRSWVYLLELARNLGITLDTSPLP